VNFSTSKIFLSFKTILISLNGRLATAVKSINFSLYRATRKRKIQLPSQLSKVRAAFLQTKKRMH